MSKLAYGLTAALIVATILPAGQAFAQRGPGGPPPPRHGGRGDICGAPLTGQAPDIMTYDSSTGTQVFVGSTRGGGTDVAAYNAQTGSAAGLSGDLSRPGLVSSCAVDGLGHEAYGVTSDRPGQVTVSGRDDHGERYQFTRADGHTEVWDPRRENRCFRNGLGLFGSSSGPGGRC